MLERTKRGAAPREYEHERLFRKGVFGAASAARRYRVVALHRHPPEAAASAVRYFGVPPSPAHTEAFDNSTRAWFTALRRSGASTKHVHVGVVHLGKLLRSRRSCREELRVAFDTWGMSCGIGNDSLQVACELMPAARSRTGAQP
jgi:hypothetical protein